MQSLQVSSKANGRRNLCDGNVVCATLPMCLCTGQCCFCISRKNKFPSNGKILSGEPNGLSELKSRTTYGRTPPLFAITVNKEFWNLVPDNKGSYELTPNSDMQKKSYTFSSFQTQKKLHTAQVKFFTQCVRRQCSAFIINCLPFVRILVYLYKI